MRMKRKKAKKEPNQHFFFWNKLYKRNRFFITSGKIKPMGLCAMSVILFYSIHIAKMRGELESARIRIWKHKNMCVMRWFSLYSGSNCVCWSWNVHSTYVYFENKFFNGNKRKPSAHHSYTHYNKNIFEKLLLDARSDEQMNKKHEPSNAMYLYSSL